jgi:pyochelin biosynthetic protein PchC
VSIRELAGPASATALWLRRLGPVTEPWARLVCFPHAGGTAAFYRPWHEYLPPDVELFSVQYPGRLDRIGEPCIDDMDLMAASVAGAVSPLMDRPMALFGHSLGAVIAYEVARRLAARRPEMLAGLFVSGRPAPDRQRLGAKHLAADDILWGELGRLGGTRPEVLTDSELRRAFLPALRSDYRLAEQYRPRPGTPLNCPVTVLLGDRDSEVDLAEAKPWASVTRGSFTLLAFPGEHFYLAGREPEVIREIVRGLAEGMRAGRPDWAGP